MQKRPLPRSLVVAVVATAAASCGPSPSKEDGGVPDAGSDGGSDAGMLCPGGCFVLMRDGGPVFYEDGGPYCLC